MSEYLVIMVLFGGTGLGVGYMMGWGAGHIEGYEFGVNHGWNIGHHGNPKPEWAAIENQTWRHRAQAAVRGVFGRE